MFKQYEPNGLPTFPQSFDIHVDRYEAAKIVRNPSDDGLTGLDDAKARYAPAAGSPALRSGSGTTSTLYDALGAPRSASAPTLGAVEQVQ